MVNQEIISQCFKLYIDNRLNSKQAGPDSWFDKFSKTFAKNYRFSLPYAFALKVTQSCNLRCKHCFYYENADFYNKNNELSTEEFYKLVDFLVDDLNILILTLTGGEPFVRDDFLDILSYIKSKNIPVRIQTNATLINEDIVLKLRDILDLKNDLIHISLEGADRESNDALRGVGTFDKVIYAIKLLRQHKISVQINTTLTALSAPKMPQILELCQDLNVSSLDIGKFKVCNEKQKDLELNDEDLFNYSLELLTAIKNYPNLKVAYKALSLFDFLKTSDGQAIVEDYIKETNYPVNLENKCLSCHRHERLTMSSEGDLFLCSFDDSEKAVLGNIREKDFMEIWEQRFENPYFQERNSKTIKCKNCKFLGLCKGGCIVNAFKKFGDINMPDSECPYFEKYIRSQDE